MAEKQIISNCGDRLGFYLALIEGDGMTHQRRRLDIVLDGSSAELILNGIERIGNPYSNFPEGWLIKGLVHQRDSERQRPIWELCVGEYWFRDRTGWLQVVDEEQYRIRRVPRFRSSGDITQPAWFHSHGYKMMLARNSDETLCIEGSHAKVEVKKHCDHLNIWTVSWEVVYSNEIPPMQGTNWIDTINLCAAFGITDDNHKYGEQLVKEYGGTCAAQGMFIRYNEYLNIPGPGTGYDGDPNASIRITDDIRLAAARFVYSHAVTKAVIVAGENEGARGFVLDPWLEQDPIRIGFADGKVVAYAQTSIRIEA